MGTVTAQLLYEIAGPAYEGPDVVARFDTVRVDRGRPRPGAPVRHPRRAGPRPAEGRHQLPRRVPELDELRPHRPRHRVQGGDGRDRPVRPPGRPRAVPVRRHPPGRPPHPRPTLRRGVRRRAPHHRQGPRPLQGRPRLLLRRHRADPGQLPRLLHHHPAHRRHPLRHLLASPGSRRPGRPDSRPRRRPPPGHQGATGSGARRVPGRADPPIPRRVPRPRRPMDPPPRCRSGGCSGPGPETREGTRTSGCGPGTSAPTASSSGS